ncbi:MAG TPA: DUF2267 domain-containing protein [Streptosporangiaceae bacterium]
MGQTRSRARLSSRGDAERATREIPETLGERIPEGLAGNLAAQLPHDIGEHLQHTEVYTGAGSGERFGRQDVIARVSERAGVDEPQPAYIIRAVTEAAGEAVPGGLMAKATESLPAGIRQLVTAGSTG